VRPLG